ncbi:tyrosine-type recombinase/integrase [Roseateles cavernae]|uniref:tyrosine-type recombinase/integrase n=1 Tax=Roseateles cavernae TaxID=3153578 RepID=UPI0032E4F87D
MSIRWDTRNKRWRYEFDRVIEGRRHRASRLLPKGWSQAQADAFDRKESGRLYALGTGVEQQDALIDTAVAHYLRDKTGLKSYKGAAENLAAIAWAYTGKPLTELPAVAALITNTREGVREGVVLSAATVRVRLALLKAACRWAWRKHGICASDPTVRMQLPQVRNERHVYADRHQLAKLLRGADRRDVRMMILAAWYTGMRMGELQRVEVQSDCLVLADTKNGERRVLPIHPKLKRLGVLAQLPLASNRSTLQRGFQRARSAAGLQHIRIHDLRHSAASEMINAEVDLFTVGAVLGHKDPRSTKRYAHLTHGTLAAAMGKIGQKSPHKPATKAA